MDHLRTSLDRRHSGRRPLNFVPPTVRQVKILIWIYFWLLIFEGALRKWVVPALSDPLLIVRDPVVLLIYFQAIRGGFFPQHWLVKTMIGLGAFTFVWGCMHIYGGSYLDLIVSAYGVRTFFLHLPLIFIMGHVFTRDDVLKMGKWILLLSIPMAALMAMQYKVSPTHFLNRSTTGDEGGQLLAALGHVRPPGTFSFITGPAVFYPLVTVFLVMGIMHPRIYRKWLIIAAAVATALVLPVSGSRSLVLASAIVMFFAGGALIRNPRFLPRFTIWAVVIVIGGGTVLALPVGQRAIESFSTRWNAAMDVEGQGEGADVAIIRRVGGGFTEVFKYLPNIPAAGYGIGAGTNVGSKLKTGGLVFLMGEGEWMRVVMEAGPFLGFTYIGFRITLAFYLLWAAWRRMLAGDPLAWLLMACAFIVLVIGQTSQATNLGFMALISGLALAATGAVQRRKVMSENQRRFLAQRARQRQVVREQPPRSGPEIDDRPLPEGVLRPR